MMCLLALSLAAGEPLVRYPFDEPPAELRLISNGDGIAAVQDGVLALDLTSPTVGKQAAARLERDLPVPCRITWEQRLAVDSEHAYWGGIELRGRWHGPVTVRLGGRGAGGGVQFPGVPKLHLQPGEWLRFELTVEQDRRVLRVTRRNDGAILATATDSGASPKPPLRLTLYSNLLPDENPDGDAYAQNRGRHEFDNLVIEAIQPPPARPGTPYDPRQTIVFNRAMRWRVAAGSPLAYDTTDQVLTGEAAVSDWAVGPAVAARAAGPTTVFTRPHADAVGPDRVVLRQLQFHLGQHPRLRYRLDPQNARARLWVTFTCPYIRHGIVLAEVPWTTAAVAGEIDLVEALARWGEERVYAELDFVLDIDAPEGVRDGQGDVAATLTLPRAEAVIAPTHLVATPASGAVRIAALVVGDEATAVVATHTDPPTPLAFADGVWEGSLQLRDGTHEGAVVARLNDGREIRQRVEVRVASHPFVAARRGEATYALDDGTRLPPLLGDLFAWVPWDDPTRPEREMIRGPETLGPERRFRLTKWRSMTVAELRERIDYLHQTGARVLRLTPNTTPYESYLDAGGHIAPHGLEQLERLLGILDEHGIRALINLFHYQYGSRSTGTFPPVSVYEEAGYHSPAGWTDPPAVALQRGYLDELLGAIGEDPAVLGYTLFGENDQIPGREWVNSTAAFVEERAPHHLLVFEQGGALQSHRELAPDQWDAYAPATDGGVGYRTYASDGVPTDAYANVCARWYAQRQPTFLGEVCSGGPGWYPGEIAWLKPDFRTKFRDNLWASLLAPQAMSLYWSVCLIESERTLPAAIAERIDWQGFRRARGQVAVVAPRASRALLPTLAKIDDACCRAGLTYDIVGPEADLAGYLHVIDATRPADAVELPAAVVATAALSLSDGNAATILTDQAGMLLLAYIRNVVEHRLGPGYGKGVRELHRQREAAREVTITIAAMPDTAEVTVWDVDTGEQVRRSDLAAGRTLRLGITSHDFAMLIRRR